MKIRKEYIFFLGFFFLLWIIGYFLVNPKKENLSIKEVHERIKKNKSSLLHNQKVKLAILRYFLLLENSSFQKEKLNDLLRKKFTLEIPGKPTLNKSEALQFLESEYSNFSFSHHILDEHLKENENALEVEILFQKLSDNQNLSSLRKLYRFSFTSDERVELRLTSVKESILSDGKLTHFKPSYERNRAQSFLNYWLLLHNLNQSSKFRFQKLLQSNDIGKSLYQEGEFIAWFALFDFPKKVQTFTPTNVKIEVLNEKTITLTYDLFFEAIDEKEKYWTGKANHSWILNNQPKKDFLKVEKFKVSIIENFRIN